MYPIDALTFIDTKNLIAAIDNGEVQVWNWVTEKPQFPLGGRLGKNPVAVSGNGKILARVEGNSICLYSIPAFKKIGVIEDNNYVSRDIAIDFSAARLASADSDGKVRLWNIKGKVLEYFWPSSSKLVALSDDGTVVTDGRQIWDGETGTTKRSFSSMGRLESLAISPNGTHLARGDAMRAELWRVK
jgi:WD40 repeat protein